MSIGVAVLGAGVFAKREHLPAIKSCSMFTLKAIYSRSQDSVEAAVNEVEQGVEAYFDSPATANKSLDKLLQRSDIHAVIIAVAIPVAPELIKKALAAGKHVLSEKPIAPDVTCALNLVKFHQDHSPKSLWAVGENFRFWDAVQKAAEKLKNLDAQLLTFSVNCFNFTDAKNPFFNSAWRQKPEFQGGYILDGSVHFIAVLRVLLAALGRQIKTVSAFTTLLQESLPPVDTVQAILRTDNGRFGSYSSSVGIECKRSMEWEIVTDKGSVVYRPFQMQIGGKLKHESGEWVDFTESAPLMWGVKEEVAAFGQSISTGSLDARLSAAEALEDIKIVEAILSSGERQGAPVQI